MIPLVSLLIPASVAVLLALLSLRGQPRTAALRDAAVVFGASIASLSLAAIAYHAVCPRTSATGQYIGSVFLLTAPLWMTLAPAFRRWSFCAAGRTLLGGGIATFVLVAWLVAYLKGPCGPWRTWEALYVVMGGALTLAAAACSARWTKTEVKQR